jgi:hypothetical protein
VLVGVIFLLFLLFLSSRLRQVKFALHRRPDPHRFRFDPVKNVFLPLPATLASASASVPVPVPVQSHSRTDSAAVGALVPHVSGAAVAAESAPAAAPVLPSLRRVKSEGTGSLIPSAVAASSPSATIASATSPMTSRAHTSMLVHKALPTTKLSLVTDPHTGLPTLTDVHAHGITVVVRPKERYAHAVHAVLPCARARVCVCVCACVRVRVCVCVCV